MHPDQLHGPPGERLRARGGSALAGGGISLRSAVGVTDDHIPTRGVQCGRGRSLPEPRRGQCGVGRSRRRTEFGGLRKAATAAGQRPGARCAFTGLDESGYRTLSHALHVRVVGDGGQRIKVVPGDDVGDLFAVTRERGTQVVSHREMPSLAVVPGQCVVGDLAQHVVREAVVAALRRERVGGDLEHLAADEVGQPRPHFFGVATRDPDQRIGGKRRTQHRGICDQRAHRRVERVQASRQQAVQAVRNRECAEVAFESVHAVARHDDVPVDECADRLHREQRDALRLRGDRNRGVGRDTRDQCIQ